MAALGLTAGSASASAAGTGPSGGTSFGFSVAPGTIRPGGLVKLSSDGCGVPSVTVSSGVLGTVRLTAGHPRLARVDPHARPGAQYAVAFTCKGEEGTAALTIVGTPAPEPAYAAATPGLTTAPTAAVAGGFDGISGRLDSTEVLAGAGLFAATAAAAVSFVRRPRGVARGRHRRC